MKTSALSIFVFWIIITPLISFSNGGPIDISHFFKTGNIRLLRIADISLIKENLNIKVVGDFTEIEVEYHLQNNGDLQKIQYGFPVDAYEISWNGSIQSYTDYDIFNGKTNIVEYFNIFENGTKVKVSQWVVDSAYNIETTGFNKKYEPTRILRKWFATTLEFKKGEIKELKVLYKIKNTLIDRALGFYYFINSFDDRNFTYHLTPSSNWGNGIVNEFNLNINLSALDSIDAEYTVTGIDSLQKNNSFYSFHKVNYDLNNSDRININYNNSHIKLSEFFSKYELPKGFIKSIRCSSNDSTINNLIDNSNKTTWTGRQGDWIEIKFNKISGVNGNISLNSLLVLNGDFSSKENFNNSGKLKNVKVTINDTIVFNTEPWEGNNGKRIIELKKPVYKNVNEKYINGLASVIADGLFEYIYKLRIEILKVDGNSGNEATLSELYFLGQ